MAQRSNLIPVSLTDQELTTLIGLCQINIENALAAHDSPCPTTVDLLRVLDAAQAFAAHDLVPSRSWNKDLRN